MIVLSWNCRGLGNPRLVWILHCLVRAKKPSLVFLMETKLRRSKMEEIKSRLCFEGLFVVDCHGRSGGLALMWNREAHMSIQNFSRGHISVVVHSGSAGKEWKFTGFYGNSNVAKRPDSWALLRHLSRLTPEPWLCIGDFNEITTATEKSSSTIRPPNQMQAFKQALEDSHLADLGFSSPKFTWCNGRSGSTYNRERLDRAVANVSCTLMFDVVGVSVLAWSILDHHPIVVDFSNNRDISWNKSRFFKYEASWTKQKEYKEIIKQV